MVVPINGYEYIIWDGSQKFEADKSYIDTGVEEGWLIFDGVSREAGGTVRYSYRMANEEPDESQPEPNYTKKKWWL